MADAGDFTTWGERRVLPLASIARAGARGRNTAADARAKLYDLYARTIEGGDAFVDVYLQSHPRELQEDFEERRKRAIYLNLAAPILRAKNAALYAQKVRRHVSGADQETFDLLASAVDAHGTGPDDFFSAVQFRAMQFGIFLVLLHPPEETSSLLAVRERPPRAEGIDPRLLVNWQLGADGGFNFAVIRRETTMRKPFGAEETRVVLELWDRGTITPHDEDGHALGPPVEHGYSLDGRPFTPVIVAFNAEHRGDLESDSELRDAAPLSRAMLNTRSLLDEVLYRQTFAQPVIEGVKAGDEKRISRTTGTGNVLLIPEGGTFRYESPDPTAAATLMSALRSDAQSLRALALMDSAQSDATQIGSGVALSYKHRDLNADLADKAQRMEQVERLFWRLRSSRLFTGSVDVTVEYPRDFDARTIEEEVDRALSALTLLVGVPTAQAELVGRTIARLIPDLAPDRREMIKHELEGLHEMGPPERGDKATHDMNEEAA